MSVLLALLAACLAFFFINLFFLLARVEKKFGQIVPLLEKFMVVRYNLKRDEHGQEQVGVRADSLE